MEQVYPLSEEIIRQFCGMPICVIMRDGSRHVGILSSCNGGRVFLNGQTNGEAEALLTNTQEKGSKKKISGKEHKGKAVKSETVQAQTQAYPYDPNYYGPQSFNPWGGAFFLDLALIAFLFLLI